MRWDDEYRLSLITAMLLCLNTAILVLSRCTWDSIRIPSKMLNHRYGLNNAIYGRVLGVLYTVHDTQSPVSISATVPVPGTPSPVKTTSTSCMCAYDIYYLHCTVRVYAIYANLQDKSIYTQYQYTLLCLLRCTPVEIRKTRHLAVFTIVEWHCHLQDVPVQSCTMHTEYRSNLRYLLVQDKFGPTWSWVVSVAG